PLAWLWPEDRNRCRRFFNDSILLSGHLHDTAGGLLSDFDGRLYQFQAGGAYLGSETNWPAGYHYITFDWNENLIKLDFRKFVKDKRKWAVDGDTGDDGKQNFQMMEKSTRRIETDDHIVLPDIYLDWLKDNYGYVEAEKLQGKGQAVPLKLPEIFIPLYAYDPSEKRS
ncbi:MAG: hypothetical protein GY850_44900, partial [bacterium]|nr:hypothetical protein [bacterium]